MQLPWEEDAPEWVSMAIGTEPHPPGVAISGGEQVVIKVILEPGAAGVAEEIRLGEGDEFRKFHWRSLPGNGPGFCLYTLMTAALIIYLTPGRELPYCVNRF